MSLKINGWRGIVKWGIIAVVAILFAVFLIRVATWENAYYNEKEGSERSVVEEDDDSEELVEVQPTEDEVREYVVPASHPRYLTIPKLGVNKARILSVGVNPGGELGTPNNIFDVGWYDSSGLPGRGGTLVIDGHNGGPHVHGVFKELPSLVSGDLIVIERGDGELFTYSVVENVTVPLGESDTYMGTAMRSPQAGKESVTLISCIGEWSSVQNTYLSRQFVRATLSTVDLGR